ncbi:DUF1349 domain-containing protein [Rheinheimera fenheensis]|uniref:DUF1349 domain-containing protein n=1 Tax=Rheinheimera fenheensis TaxID=3152295 RepID=UPI00325D5B40
MNFSVFKWLNKPSLVENHNDSVLSIKTDPNTDFWQETYYDMRVDNGHFLFSTFKTHAIEIQVSLRSDPHSRYDQAGLMIRKDAFNWLKLSTEFENHASSWLGSVNTKAGLSDWATQEVVTSKHNAYKIIICRNDALLFGLVDGNWQRIRILDISHLYVDGALNIGVYACSPKGSGYEVIFDSPQICY